MVKLGLALCERKRFLGDNHGHSERATRLALTFRAVTGDDLARLRRDLVAYSAALATAFIGCGHRISPYLGLRRLA